MKQQEMTFPMMHRLGYKKMKTALSRLERNEYGNWSGFLNGMALAIKEWECKWGYKLFKQVGEKNQTT